MRRLSTRDGLAPPAVITPKSLCVLCCFFPPQFFLKEETPTRSSGIPPRRRKGRESVKSSRRPTGGTLGKKQEGKERFGRRNAGAENFYRSAEWLEVPEMPRSRTGGGKTRRTEGWARRWGGGGGDPGCRPDLWIQPQGQSRRRGTGSTPRAAGGQGPDAVSAAPGGVLTGARGGWAVLLGEARAPRQGRVAWSQAQLSPVLRRWTPGWPGTGAPRTPGLPRA